MMEKKFRGLLILGLLMVLSSIGLVVLTLSTLTLSAQTILPSADRSSSPELALRDAIEKIEAARLSGRLTTDRAARYRLWTLADPTRLPPEFQPTATAASFTADEAVPHDGLPELAEMLDALFVDQADWSAETRMAILAEFEEGERRSRAVLDALTETPTEHFTIHWDNTGGPDTPPEGFTYIVTLADELEHAWQALEGYGYEMPDAADFGKSVDLAGNARFDVYVVDEIRICDVIRITRSRAGAVTLPGDMWFFNDHDPDKLDTMTAHELFHMLQWNYADFHDSGCLGKLGAWSWYTDKGAWLMESTATWIEDEIYPNDNDYIGKIHQYTDFPEVSLFAGPAFSGNSPQAQRHEYGAVIFIKFLQEHLADSADYNPTRDIVRDIWENVPLQNNSTVGAVTHVLMHPPSGASPYEDYTDTWRSIFDDFAVANYLKDYDDGHACSPPRDPQLCPHLWPDVEIAEVEQPQARPPVPVEKNFPGFDSPGAQYVEIRPSRLNLPGGADATGATLHLEFSTSCPNCTLDVLTFHAGGTPTRTTLPLTMSGSIVFSASADLATDFGGAGGVNKAILVFSNGPQDFFPQGYYDYALTATDNPPETPTLLTATADASTLRDRWIQLVWDRVRENGITYNVYRSRTSPVPTDNAHRIASGLQSRRYRDNSISWEATYFYVVTAVDSGGNSGSPSGEASARLVLFDNVQVAPNPFTPDGDGVDDVTRIAYTLALPPRENRVHVSAEILDQSGNRVQRLRVRPPVQGRGSHSVIWDGSSQDGTIAAVGLYTFRITARSTSGGPPVVRRTGEVQLAASSRARGFDPTDLTASYYDGFDLTGFVLSEPWTEPIDFLRTCFGEPFPFEGCKLHPALEEGGNYSASWEGTLIIPVDGDYTFRFSNVDNEARLLVELDGILTNVLSSGGASPNPAPPVTVSLVGPTLPLRVEFKQFSPGAASLTLQWQGPGFVEEVIPLAGTGGVTPVSVLPAQAIASK